MLIFLLGFLVLASSGCATIHTTPLLVGDVPTGLPAWGTLKEGSTYSDPRGRFTLIVPGPGLKAKRDPRGTILFSTGESGPLPWEISYGVLEYKSTTDGKFSFEQCIEAIRRPVENRKYWKMGILYKSQQMNAPAPTLDLELVIRDARPTSADRSYAGRLVAVGQSIYWIYYSTTATFDSNISQHDRARAENFARSVVFMSK